MKFTTTIAKGQTKDTTGVIVPPGVIEALGAGKRPPVTVTLNGYSYAGTVASMGGIFMVSLSAEHRSRAGVTGGETLEVEIEHDALSPDGRGSRRPRLGPGGRPCTSRLRRPGAQPPQGARSRRPGRQGRGHPPAPHRRGGRQADERIDPMKLYGIAPTRAVRALWVLNELGLECEILGPDPRDPDDRRAIKALNPAVKVPILQDGDLILTESTAISLYLADRYGEGRLLPRDAIGRARLNEWMFHLATEIEQPLWRIARHGFIYPEADQREAERPLAIRDLKPELAKVEARLADHDVLVGDALSVADFSAAYLMDWADGEGLLADAPACRAFLERMYDRPAAPPRIAEAFTVLKAGGMPPRRRADLPPQPRTEETLP